jgi:hypothetical protein
MLQDMKMATAFEEFSSAFDQFIGKFPDHPMTEEIRRVISKNRFPGEQWLRAQTKRMNDLMAPFWLKGTPNQ